MDKEELLEAIDTLKVASLDIDYPSSCNVAIELALNILKEKLSIEESPLDYVCMPDNQLYPNAHSIFARILNETEDAITIERFSKFGAVSLGIITISKNDFNLYYKKLA